MKKMKMNFFFQKTFGFLFLSLVFHLTLTLSDAKKKMKWTALDHSIASGNLVNAKNLWENGERPKGTYHDSFESPVHSAAYSGHTSTLEWVFEHNILPRTILCFKDVDEFFPLDAAMYGGCVETAKLLWEYGGRSNLDGIYFNPLICETPIHTAAYTRNIDMLKWTFENGILPLEVLDIDAGEGTPLDIAMDRRDCEVTINYLKNIHKTKLLIKTIFPAMQRAKRDHRGGTLLRRLPHELLDMVVDEVAARAQRRVEWKI